MKRLSLAVIILSAALSALAGEITLPGDTVVRLAGPEEAREILSTEDAFTSRLMPFEMKVRMWTDREVSREDFLAHAGAQALGFSDDEHERLESTFAAITAKLDALDLRLPFPPVITLVKSAGLEEGGAAYCRGAVIVFPARLLWAPEDILERIMTHELFHILTSANPDLRDPLYGIMGFVPCDHIELPRQLAEITVTNPDAFWNTHYIEVNFGGKVLKVIPVNLLDMARYDPGRQGRIFDLLDSRLLVVEKRERWAPALVDGRPWLLDPHTAGDYIAKLGRNTDYIIHPEEVLAENFQLMVIQKRDIPSPAIPAKMLEILREYSARGEGTGEGYATPGAQEWTSPEEAPSR